VFTQTPYPHFHHCHHPNLKLQSLYHHSSPISPPPPFTTTQLVGPRKLKSQLFLALSPSDLSSLCHASLHWNLPPSNQYCREDEQVLKAESGLELVTNAGIVEERRSKRERE